MAIRVAWPGWVAESWADPQGTEESRGVLAGEGLLPRLPRSVDTYRLWSCPASTFPRFVQAVSLPSQPPSCARCLTQPALAGFILQMVRCCPKFYRWGVGQTPGLRGRGRMAGWGAPFPGPMMAAVLSGTERTMLLIVWTVKGAPAHQTYYAGSMQGGELISGRPPALSPFGIAAAVNQGWRETGQAPPSWLL